jgi:hypothetical protein
VNDRHGRLVPSVHVLGRMDHQLSLVAFVQIRPRGFKQCAEPGFLLPVPLVELALGLTHIMPARVHRPLAENTLDDLMRLPTEVFEISADLHYLAVHS